MAWRGRVWLGRARLGKAGHWQGKGSTEYPRPVFDLGYSMVSEPGTWDAIETVAGMIETTAQ